MPKNTRYDKFARLISRDFERVKTFENDTISANGREILVDGHSEGWRSENSEMAQFRPFNTLSIENDSSSDVTLYLNRSQDAFIHVIAGESRSLTADFYFNYVEVEEEDGAEISAGDVHVLIGKTVCGRELELLKMAGMLNVRGD